jgi:hypothetical protein
MKGINCIKKLGVVSREGDMVSNWGYSFLVLLPPPPPPRCILYNLLYHKKVYNLMMVDIRGLLEKYPTFGREKETGLLGALDT